MKKNNNNMDNPADIAGLIENEVTEDSDLDVSADFPSDAIADTSNGVKGLRGRVMMYTQRVDIIIKNFGSIANFEHFVENTLCDTSKGDRFAMVLHNMDKSSVAGKLLADDHIHLALEFANPHYVTAIVKALQDYRDDGSPNVQTITLFKGNVGNLYSYLCHRTKKASNKYQYDPSIVKANFDYVKELGDITTAVTVAQKSKEAKSNIGVVLEELKARIITLQEVEKLLPASVYAQSINSIRNVWTLAMKLEAETWRERKLALREKTKIIWVWGRPATGKSSFGRDYVSKDGKDYYVAGSSNAMWDGYESYMHTALIDECRPDMFKTYRDMLSILDNYQVRAVAPARYYDRELALDTIVITTVYSPYEFYQLMDIKNPVIDEFYQLERRITECIYMDDYFMMNSYFNPESRKYEVDIDSLVYNPYSEARRGTKKVTTDRSNYYDVVHSAPMVSAHNESMNEDVDEPDTDESEYDEYMDDYYDDSTIEDALNLIDEIEDTDDMYLDEDLEDDLE